MKHLELHIIQSVPVSCLNRDDLNSPKTAIFGGVQRARVSSQSWKRAVRELSKESDATLFNGNRSRRLVYELSRCFENKGISKDNSVTIAEHVASIVETLDDKTDADGFKKIKTMMFFSKAEYEAIANSITDEVKKHAEEYGNAKKTVEKLRESLKQEGDGKKEESMKKQIEKMEKRVADSLKALEKALSDKSIRSAIKSAQLKDAADIALFGRMVANDHSLTVEAASLFSHALSTHKVDNEIDFFSAVDDLQSKEESGAGMTGTLEYNSATYYRFAGLNLDMLADAEHLGSMTKDERQRVVKTFLKATIEAIPSARKNTMNGNTRPNYVLGVVREKGHPIQLVNAFEVPIRSNNGYADKSIELLKAEYKRLSEKWGITAVFEKAIPDISMSEFLDGMVAHVD